MKLLFVRHGITDQTAKGMQGPVEHDDVLNDEGIEQAKRAAAICAEFNPSIVYTSPFKRTAQTAEIIAARSDSKLVRSDDLREYFVGDWKDLTLEEGKKKFIELGMWNYNEEKYDFRPPGGESWRDVFNRTGKIVREVTSQSNNDDTVVLVTHNVALKAMVGSLLGKSFEQCLPLMFKTGSVTAFEYKNDTFTELFVDKT